MKRILIILVISFTFFGTIPSAYAVDDSAILTNEEFNKKMAQKGYDIVKDDDDNTSATKGNITFQFIYFDDENQAKFYLARTCDDTDSYEYTSSININCSRGTISHNGYVSYLYNDDNYVVASRRNNTIMTAVGRDEDKDEIDLIMKEFGYYYEEQLSEFYIAVVIISIVWLICVIIAVILGVTRRKKLEKSYQYNQQQSTSNNMYPYQNYPNNYYRF